MNPAANKSIINMIFLLVRKCFELKIAIYTRPTAINHKTRTTIVSATDLFMFLNDNANETIRI